MEEDFSHEFSVFPGENNCVLVAVDFSEDSRAALVWASRYSDLCGDPLVILHVVHDPASDPGFYRKALGKPLQPLREAAEEMMDEFIDSVLEENPKLAVVAEATRHLVPGLPASRIVEVSNMLGSSMVVIGSRGLTGLKNILLGSVATKVVKLSARPVVVIKSENSKRRKKERKKAEKRQKKEQKRLKTLLGMATAPDSVQNG